MQAGCIVFDGVPAELRSAKVYDIHGVTENEFHANHAAAVYAFGGFS